MDIDKVIAKLLTVKGWTLEGENPIGSYKFYRRYVWTAEQEDNVIPPKFKRFSLTTEEELIPRTKGTGLENGNVADQWKIEKAALYFAKVEDGKGNSILLSEDYEVLKELIDHVRKIVFKDATNSTDDLKEFLSDFISEKKPKKK